MGKRRRHAKQASMWVATQDLPRSAAHPFYTRLNQILDEHDFDGYVEGLLRAILRGRGPARAAAGPLFPAAADRLFRRPGCRARDCVACRGFVCAARVSRVGVARGAAGPFDDLAHASLDRSRDARGRLHLDAAAPGRRGLWSRARPSALTRRRWRPMRRCAASCGATRARATRTS